MTYLYNWNQCDIRSLSLIRTNLFIQLPIDLFLSVIIILEILENVLPHSKLDHHQTLTLLACFGSVIFNLFQSIYIWKDQNLHLHPFKQLKIKDIFLCCSRQGANASKIYAKMSFMLIMMLVISMALSGVALKYNCEMCF